MNIISGDSIRNVCDYVIDVHRTNENPFCQKFQHVGASFCSYQDKAKPDFLIFVHASFLTYFQSIYNQEIPDKINGRRVVLISHHSDRNIQDDNECRGFLSWCHRNDIKWIAQNADIEGVGCIPIGVEDCRVGRRESLRQVMSDAPRGNRSNLVSNYREHVDRLAVSECLRRSLNLRNQYLPGKSDEDYYTEIKRHRFAISPEGAGYDCHRHYSCLALGTIPIVKRRVFTEKLSEIYPMILVNKWEDLDLDAIKPNTYRHMMAGFNRKFLDSDYLLRNHLGIRI